MFRAISAGLIAIAWLAAACGDGEGGTGVETTEAPDQLTIISHDSFVAGVTDDTFAPFTEETGIEVDVLGVGDAGSLVNQAVLTKDNPLADVLFGVDDTFLSRALEAEIFIPHSAEGIDQVPESLVLDDQLRVTPIDYGDVCLNYDKEAVGEAIPSTLSDLTQPQFAGMLVTENPATSSPGLAFLLSTISLFGEDGWQDFWQGLVDNDLKVAPDWDTAYYGDFTRYGGDRPIVVSYASSPPAEVIFGEPPPEEAPTGVVTDGCYRQIEFAGVLAGTQYEEAAGQLIDYMLTVEFQESIPLTWFVFPANQQAELPAEFVEHTVLPDQPITLDPASIEANRERWIEEWSQIVLP